MKETEPINLYEYQKTEEKFDKDCLDKLEIYLDEIWKRRDKNDSQYSNDDPDNSTQQFLQFFRDNKVKQKNYVGVIQFQDKTINLLPKIFNNDDDIKKINLNIIWWLSYTTKIKFPKSISSLASIENSFLEIIIWLFASYTKETLNNNLFQNYVEVESETSYVKGQFMFNDYINQHLARAKWGKVYCRYDSFELDNEFNRIIKYVANLLMNFSQNDETKHLLQDIIFILSDVSDERFTIEDCSKVRLNHFQSDFVTILEYCKLFLTNSISVNYRNKLEVFAFLIPMEKLFEEFIYGFIQKELKLGVKSQSSGIFLTEDKSYKLKPDLKITYNSKEYIADTKYKILNFDDKKPVSQSDLYQMVAYAIRYKCENIILFYPKTEENENKINSLNIIDEFPNQTITIYPYQLDIKCSNFDLKSTNLERIFEKTKNKLVKQINGLLEGIS